MIASKYIKSPCYGCVPPKRNSTCHSTCEEYKNYLLILEQENKKIKEEKRIDSAINQICCDGALSNQRPRALKRKRDK